MLLKMTNFINKNFWLFLLLAFGSALLFPHFSSFFYPHIQLILAVIMFCSFLKVDLQKFLAIFKKPLLPIVYIVFSLLILPYLFWLGSSFLPNGVKLGILLIVLMPQGIATPTLIALIGGELEFTVVTLVLSYFITPLTTILMLKLLIGGNVTLDYTSLFISLVLLIFIPFFLAQGLKLWLKEKVEKCNPFFTFVSVFMMSALIMGAIGKNAASIKANFVRMLYPIFLTYLTFILLFIAGIIFAYLFKQKSPNQIITHLINTGFKNNSLGLVIADKYFSPEVVLFLVLSSLPWNTLLGPVKLFYQKFLLKSEK